MVIITIRGYGHTAGFHCIIFFYVFHKLRNVDSTSPLSMDMLSGTRK